MKDQMSLLSGVAESYSTLPLSMLHQLQSVLSEEIKHRLELFGENRGKNVQNGEGCVGDVEREKAGLSGENNVILVDFKRGNE